VTRGAEEPGSAFAFHPWRDPAPSATKGTKITWLKQGCPKQKLFTFKFKEIQTNSFSLASSSAPRSQPGWRWQCHMKGRRVPLQTQATFADLRNQTCSKFYPGDLTSSLLKSGHLFKCLDLDFKWLKLSRKVALLWLSQPMPQFLKPGKRRTIISLQLFRKS